MALIFENPKEKPSNRALLGAPACELVSEIFDLIDSIPKRVACMEETQYCMLKELHAKRLREMEDQIRILREKASQETNKLKSNPTIHLLAGQVLQLTKESEKLEKECSEFTVNINGLRDQLLTMQESNAVMEECIIVNKKKVRDFYQQDQQNQVPTEHELDHVLPIAIPPVSAVLDSPPVTDQDKVFLLNRIKRKCKQIRNNKGEIELMKLKVLLKRMVCIDPQIIHIYNSLYLKLFVLNNINLMTDLH